MSTIIAKATVQPGGALGLRPAAGLAELAPGDYELVVRPDAQPVAEGYEELALPEPLEIDWPALHSTALGCGVEDRGLHGRYECAEYGFQEGVDQAASRVPDDIYDSATVREIQREAFKAGRAQLAERVAVLEAAQVPEGMVIAPHYRGYANLGTGQYVLNHSKAGEPMEFVISVATDAEKAGRVVGDERDNAPDALLQPEAMAVRIAFASLAGLEALENQLSKMRLEHGFATPQPHADEAAKGGA